MNKEFSAVLLAGGASSRMGMPKALVPIGANTLWRRQVGVLKELGPAELMISAGLDWDPGPGPWTILRDRTRGLGPLEGIGAALAAMSTDLLLVLAIDMPAMSAAYLQGLLDSAGPMGVVPMTDGFFQGLSAVYPRSAAKLMEEVLISGDHSIQQFMKEAFLAGLFAERQVSNAELYLFKNVNRPGDL